MFKIIDIFKTYNLSKVTYMTKTCDLKMTDVLKITDVSKMIDRSNITCISKRQIHWITICILFNENYSAFGAGPFINKVDILNFSN